MGFGAPTNRVLTKATGVMSSIVCTLPNNPAAGNPVIITLCYVDAGRTSCNPSAQDGNGNNYIMSEEDGRPTSAGILALGRALSLNAVKDKVITVSFDATGSGGVVDVEIEEFPVSGGTASFNNSITTSSAISPASSPATPIATPIISTAAGDLIVEAAISDHQVTTCDTPFTPVVEGVSGSSGTGIFGTFAQGIGYNLNSAGGNIPCAFTQNTSSDWVSGAIAYHFTPSASKVPYQPQYGMAPVMAQ